MLIQELEGEENFCRNTNKMKRVSNQKSELVDLRESAARKYVFEWSEFSEVQIWSGSASRANSRPPERDQHVQSRESCEEENRPNRFCDLTELVI